MFSSVGKGLMIGRISALEFPPNVYKIKFPIAVGFGRCKKKKKNAYREAEELWFYQGEL
jgi:hypothetical protein